MIGKVALLAVLFISALAPAQKLHDSNRGPKHKREVVAVPEGGSGFAYFALSSGAAAAAVLIARKRRRSEAQSG